MKDEDVLPKSLKEELVKEREMFPSDGASVIKFENEQVINKKIKEIKKSLGKMFNC